MIFVGYKVLQFINDEDQEALGYKTLWHTNAIASHRKINNSVGAMRLTTLRRAGRKYIGLSATRMDRMLGEEIG